MMVLSHAQPTFWADGACRDLPAEWFHPERGESTTNAKAVCASCSVRVDCLTWALDNHEKFGIWGGTSERERRRIRRRLRAGQPVPELVVTDEEEDVDLEIATADTDASPAANGTGRTVRTPTAGPLEAQCAQCGKTFTKKRKDQRFHTQECVRQWYMSHPARTRKPRTKRAGRPAAPKAVAAAPVVSLPASSTRLNVPPPPTSNPVDLQSLLGSLLAGCDHWTVEADLGDVHVTVSRGDR